MFIDFWNFLQGLQSYCGQKILKFHYMSLHIWRGYVYSFCQIFQRLHLFKGLRLFQTLEYVKKVSTIILQWTFVIFFKSSVFDCKPKITQSLKWLLSKSYLNLFTKSSTDGAAHLCLSASFILWCLTQD